jgi:F-type H+-transporting ATPase subunit a
MGQEPVLSITKLVNFLLGKPAAALLALLHIHPKNPQFPIPNHVAMEMVVVLFSVVFFLWLKRRLSVDRPGATQQCMEWVFTNPMGIGVRDLLDDIVGHGAEKHVAIFGSIGIFILFCNLLSLVPGLESPTAANVVPLACAVVVFLYYNWHGLRHHGPVRYGKTFLGPVPFIAPLMLIIEPISHFARVLSLTVRLWANMMVSELVYLVFLGLTVSLTLFTGHLNPAGYALGILPIGFPLILIVLHVLESFLQAFIFTILPIVYLGFALAEEH